MDATEVTNAQYAEFLDAGVAVSPQSAGCAWNATYVPSEGWPP
jgi:formylglycine-generating enzyme required for sulfatase activity